MNFALEKIRKRTKSDGESEKTYKDLETRLAVIETKQVEIADSLKHFKQQLTVLQNAVKELQENQYFIRNTSMQSFEITSVKGKHPDGEYETLDTKQSLTSTDISKDNCEKHNNEGETKNSVERGLVSNADTAYTIVNKAETIESSSKYGNTTTPVTATVLQDNSFDKERNDTGLSSVDVNTIIANNELDNVEKPLSISDASCLADEKHVTTVLQNDVIEKQIQSSVTSDTATVLQKIDTDFERNATKLSTSDIDKSITNAKIDKSVSSSVTSSLSGRKHAAKVLQNDATKQQVKPHVMPENATKLQRNSIDYKSSATELSTTDVNRRNTEAELNSVDKSISNNGLSCLADATHTTLSSDNVVSKPEHASGLSPTGSLTMNENDLLIKPEEGSSKDKTISSIKIKKPNFGRGRISTNVTCDGTTQITHNLPAVIEQNHNKFYEDHLFWDFLGRQELREAVSSGLMDTDGVHTVICIDISFSMSRDDVWKHVTTFLNSYIGGLEEVAREHGFKDEHVALATFGHDTSVIQRFTNDMSKIRTALGNIKLGGPSPMYGGLEMATFATASAESKMGHINGIPVPTKIVLITDGELTDSCQYQGHDEADLNKLEETKTHVLSTMEFYQSKASIDFFCMPVGNANTDFLQLMTGVANGKMISYMEGRRFARGSYLMTKTRISMSFDPMGLIGQMSGSGSSKRMLDSDLTSGVRSSDMLGFLSKMSEQVSSDSKKLFSQMSGQSSSDKEDMSLSTQDKEQIEDIKKDAEAHMDRMCNSVAETLSQQDRMYLDPNSSKLPAVGTRVRRGPDWKYHMQDSNGPGTVTGQYEGGMMLWVEWDADAHTSTYRYGHGNYDLLIVDEPRNVTDGKLAVGCTVRPGKDFQYRDTKVGQQERGVAIKINQVKQTVRVKWGNQERGKYKYSDNRHGKMEVELCSYSSPLKKQQPNMFAPERGPSKKSTYRNKNKNT